MSILRKILFPVALLYGFFTQLRNSFYDLDILSSRSYPFPVICVGNLSMGGTGKTPMIEYLLNLLEPSYKVATLSRGYGRKTKGFILLNGNETAGEVGDEPLQFKMKFPDAAIAVDENRQRGIERLTSMVKMDAVLLDDAFQHRKVRAGLNILLTTYGNIYADDVLFPTGNLRESRTGAKRANLIIVTKCPKGMGPSEMIDIKHRLNLRKNQSLFFSFIKYSERFRNEKDSISVEDLKGKKVSLVTGIANPEPLKDFLKEKNIEFEHLNYADHHNFTQGDLDLISKAQVVITTEKDYMRLKDLISHSSLYYLSIKTEFLQGKEKFDEAIKEYISA